MKKALLLMFVTVLVGCGSRVNSGIGFTLPEGDVQQGQDTFVRLQCHACHTVDGVQLEEIEQALESPIVLGGSKPYTKTYGELVTSIINPSHRFAAGYPKDEVQENGESKMRLYNDEMTVTELVDLVTFLQSHYKLKPFEPTPYVPYY